MSVILEPLQLGPLTLKNRVLRSSLGGRWDNYDGSGTDVRISWESSSRAAASPRSSPRTPLSTDAADSFPASRLIDRDDRIPFFRELGKRVHEHDCKYIVQLNHAGRHRDIGDLEFPKGVSSTGKPEPVHGFPCER